MDSIICALVCMFRGGNRIIPLETSKEELVVTVHLSSQNFFILRRVFSCNSLAHCKSKSPDLRFLIHFGSPCLLMRNGEREEMMSSCSSFTARKVRKGAEIRNPYSQAPHLTKDTTWESNKNTIKHHKQVPRGKPSPRQQ